MKRIDFENGNTTSNLLNAAFPMLIAQLLALLYNIVDRIYIARIPDIGTTALGAVGLCFPIIVIITAFANLLGTGGAPIFSICRGKKDVEHARQIMGISFTLLCGCSLILMLVGMLFANPLLLLFATSKDALKYAYPYLMIYLIGTLPSMITTSVKNHLRNHSSKHPPPGTHQKCRKNIAPVPVNPPVYPKRYQKQQYKINHSKRQAPCKSFYFRKLS